MISLSLFRGDIGWNFKILQEIIDRSILENAFLFGRYLLTDRMLKRLR